VPNGGFKLLKVISTKVSHAYNSVLNYSRVSFKLGLTCAFWPPSSWHYLFIIYIVSFRFIYIYVAPKGLERGPAILEYSSPYLSRIFNISKYLPFSFIVIT